MTDSARLKVLHVVSSFMPRTERFIYNYLMAFQRITPYVLAATRENEKEFPFPRLYVIPRPAKRRPLLWIRSKIYEGATGNSLRMERIEKLVSNLQPDIIHAHFGQNGYEMLAVKIKFKIPLVTTFYGFDMSALPKDENWLKKYQELFSEGDLFLVEGPFMRGKLVDLGAPTEKVEVQRIAIRVDDYPKWKPRYECPTVLFIGRMIEKKGLLNALAAFHQVKKNVSNLHFRIVGKGPEENKAILFVKDHHLQDSVFFLGMKSHKEIVEELSRAHVFIQPSVTAQDGDSEGGAPTTLLEAQAVGIPIVTTRHADIPSVIEEGQPGIFLCRERDVAGLARALEASLQLRQSVERSFVDRYHDIQKEVVHLESKYAKLKHES